MLSRGPGVPGLWQMAPQGLAGSLDNPVGMLCKAQLPVAGLSVRAGSRRSLRRTVEMSAWFV